MSLISVKNKAWFRCKEDVTFHPLADLAIIKTEHKLIGATPIAIPSNTSDHPEDNEAVYAVGWGRACGGGGKKCKDQSRQPNELQVCDE